MLFRSAQKGLDRVGKMLAAQVAETLVNARRARSEGRLVTAVAELRVGLKRSPAAILDAELAQVVEELSQRQKVIFKLVRTAILQQQFNKASQLLTQAELLGSDPDALTELKIDLNLARAHEVSRQLEMARQNVARKSFDSGLKAYRRALDIEPENAEALAGLRHGRSMLGESIAQSLFEAASAHRSGNLAQARLVYNLVLELEIGRAHV